MRTDNAMHGMNAVIAELTADAGELQGSLQECLTHGFALLVPVFVAVVALIEAYGIEGIPAACVLSEIHAQDVYDLVFADALPVEGTETVALVEAEEVNGPGIYIRQLKD